MANWMEFTFERKELISGEENISNKHNVLFP